VLVLYPLFYVRAVLIYRPISCVLH